MLPKFTIRIYGILKMDGNLLLSKEKYGDKEMVKFPGGGLEFGEGSRDCLKREMMEEFQMEVNVLSHYYTTDFFVESAFHKQTQVISIYYEMVSLTEIPVDRVFNDLYGQQMLFWQPLASIDYTVLTFPIDQHVAQMILK